MDLFWINKLGLSARGLGLSVRTKQKKLGYAPKAEPLEDRLVPADFVVTSLADSGVGTLRAAMIGLMDPFNMDQNNTIFFSEELPSGVISLGCDRHSARLVR